MSLDYQVKVLTGDAAEDSSTLPANSPLVDRGGPIQTGATAALVSEVARLEAEKADVDARIKELEQQQRESRSDEAVTQMLNEAWDLWGKLQTKTTEMQFELENQRAKYSGSSNSIFTKTNSEVVNKVEDFLLKLYSTLDDAHQLFESAIRGDKLPMQDAADLVPRPTPKRHVSPNAASTSPPSELAPPFSAPNRFMLGDASAAVGSAESNVNNLSKAWSDFSKDLRGDSAKRNLSTQISQDKASIARLTATRDQLIKQRDTNATVIGVDFQKQIDTLSQEIAKTQKQLLDNQTKLATL
jgi:hypothetical protein